MSRYATMFRDLGDDGAFIPFCVVGDPTPERSLANMLALIEGGADALELGIPFSDPVADGPTIQAADVRALEAGTTPQIALDVIAEVRAQSDLPIGLLMYANLVRDDFYARAKMAGVDSVLVADVPTVEARAFVDGAQAAGIEPVMIATPNASDEALAEIAALSRGYTYVVTRLGVTGSERTAGGGHETLDREAGVPRRAAQRVRVRDLDAGACAGGAPGGGGRGDQRLCCGENHRRTPRRHRGDQPSPHRVHAAYESCHGVIAFA